MDDMEAGKRPYKGAMRRFSASVRGSDPTQKAAAGNIFKFLALLLVFTLIARGTSGVTLAKVEVSSPRRATIIEAVTGSAVVSSRNTIDVYAPEGLTIREMYVGSGQKIASGDAIALFDAGEVRNKLARALAELDKTLVDLERLERMDEADSSAMESAQRSLQRAKEDYETVRAQGEADILEARAALEEALHAAGDDVEAGALENAVRSLVRAQEDHAAVKAQGEMDVKAALEALAEKKESQENPADNSSLETAKRNLLRAKDDYDSTKTQGEADVKAASDALAAAKRSPGTYVDFNGVENASRNLQRARADYDAVRIRSAADVKAAQDALDEADEADPEYERLERQLADAKKKAEDDLLAAKRKVEDAETALWNAEEAYNKSSQQSYDSWQADVDRAQTAYDSARVRADDNLLSAARRVEDAEAAYQKAEQDFAKNTEQAEETRQTELERAQTAYDSSLAKASENLLSSQRRLEDAEIALSRAESDYNNNERKSSEKLLSDIQKAQDGLSTALSRAGDNLLSAARRVEDAEISLGKAGQDYDKSAGQSRDTTVQNSANATLLRFDIDKQEETVHELDKLLDSECVLYSEFEGVVFSTMAEGKVTNSSPVVSFRDSSKGYEASMRLSKTDAAKLTVGDECEVSVGTGSMYYTPTVSASVSAISAPDESDMINVTLRLPDRDWTEGQKIDAQIVISSGNYDLCVPVSAIRSDNTGYYLYVTEPRNTVLGMQNIVVRVNVSIVASDDEYASVRGALERDSGVIVSSNKSVQQGDRVRAAAE